MDIIDILILVGLVFLAYKGFIKKESVMDAYFIIESLVESAEQRYRNKNKAGSEKLQYVLNRIEDLKLKLDPTLVLDFIESAVRRL